VTSGVPLEVLNRCAKAAVDSRPDPRAGGDWQAVASDFDRAERGRKTPADVLTELQETSENRGDK